MEALYGGAQALYQGVVSRHCMEGYRHCMKALYGEVLWRHCMWGDARPLARSRGILAQQRVPGFNVGRGIAVEEGVYRRRHGRLNCFHLSVLLVTHQDTLPASLRTTSLVTHHHLLLYHPPSLFLHPLLAHSVMKGRSR